MHLPELGLGFEGTHILITGAAGYIGRVCVTTFLSAGAYVTALDINEAKLNAIGDHQNLFKVTADITNETQLESAFAAARSKYGVVACCVALASLDLDALPHHGSIADMPTQQIQRTLQVNVQGTFLTARTWLREIKSFATPDTRNVSLIIMGSESGHFGVRENPDYAAGKSAVQFGLLQSLKTDVPKVFPGARVNAIAPGPVDTELFQQLCRENPEVLWMEAQATTAAGKPVPVLSVAKGILFLASDAWSGSIMGQVLNVDNGKQGRVQWTKEEIKLRDRKSRLDSKL